MTGDKTKFENLEHYDGGSIEFGNVEPYYVNGKCCITLTDELRCENAY